MIAGLGLGLDHCWSRSRTEGLGRQPVLISKILLGFGLEAGGLDYNTVTYVFGSQQQNDVINLIATIHTF